MIKPSSVYPIVLAALWIGCSDAEPAARPAPAGLGADEQWRVVTRFAPGRTPASLPPTATIGDETRPVLQAFEPVTLNYTPAYPVAEDGGVALHPPLPPKVQVESVFLSIRVKPGDRWVTLPGQRVASRLGRGKLRVDVLFDLPKSAGGKAGVWVQAMAPPSPHQAPLRTESFEVPPRARLDFAIGILEAAWEAGPVDFGVDVCEEDRCDPLFSERLDPTSAAGQGFRDHTVGLEHLVGRIVSLRFSARPIGSEDARTLPLWAEPMLSRAETRGGGDYNLVLLSLDTLRADHMGTYGYPRATTPFMDELSQAGVLFESFVAASSSTRPSHMTMFTSLAPSVHGATENTGIRALPVGATTLAELLHDAGLATAAITENGAIDRSRGFARGFEVYVENRDSQSASMRTGHIEQTFAQGLEWLDTIPGRRFFLFLHTYQVHNPFTPPPAYGDFFAGTDGVPAPPPALRKDWDPRLYDREIRYTDDRVRALVEALGDRGLLENTYFVLTADHGEAFLEHGFVAHGANVHHEVVNVPLVVTGPDVPAGRRLANPVPMVDLMPTILELLGAPGSGGEMGRSQAAVVRGAPENDGPPRPIYSEAWAERAYRARGFEIIPQPTIALRLGDLKIVRSRISGKGSDAGAYRYELYDLASDPREEVDLFDEQAESAAELIGLLETYDALVARLHDGLGQVDSETAPAVDPDLQEKLRALGYID